MNDTHQAMHCGDTDCCRGVLYPDCQTTICGDSNGSPVQ